VLGDRFRQAAIPLLLIVAATIAAEGAPEPPGQSPAPQIPPPPAVTVNPQITVQPATPTVVVQPAPAHPLQTWLPVAVAILSAGVASASFLLALRSQRFSFQKDLSTFLREYKAKHAAISQQRFENNVARPVGMMLDTVERMMGEMIKLQPAPPKVFEREFRLRAAALMADHLTCLRLCREADDALPVDGNLPTNQRQRPFRTQYVATRLDAAFLEAIAEALQPPKMMTAVDRTIDTVVALKVELRKRLEAERLAEANRWLGDIKDDPLYSEVLKRMPGGGPQSSR
jgi:hypothetical protein